MFSTQACEVIRNIDAVKYKIFYMKMLEVMLDMGMLRHSCF